MHRAAFFLLLLLLHYKCNSQAACWQPQQRPNYANQASAPLHIPLPHHCLARAAYAWQLLQYARVFENWLRFPWRLPGIFLQVFPNTVMRVYCCVWVCVCPKCLLSIKCPQVLLLRTLNIFQCEWLLIANCNASVSATLRPRGALLPRIVINLVIQKCTHSQSHIHSTLSLTHTHSQALESGINSSRVAVARRPDPAWQAVMFLSLSLPLPTLRVPFSQSALLFPLRVLS